MKQFIIAMCLAGSVAINAAGADNQLSLFNLKVDTRLDYQRDWLDGSTVKDNTGFEGKYLNFRIDGNLTRSLSYSWRQRLNKMHSDASFFDATDWIYINYDFGRWSVAGGKQVVAIGGWEYDRAPIDLYSCSVFWNNIPCYQIGGSVGFKPTESDKLTFQWCESPFHTADNRDMYAYNLMWTGHHGIYDAICSANLIEYQPGKYINYIALGNKFTVDKWTLELDLMNRAASHQTFFLKDMSVMGELAFHPTAKWKVFGKVTYDVNHSGTDADYCVMSGTELTMAGGGVEFMPVQTARYGLRFHANAFYSWGNNANAANVMQDRTTMLDLGFKLNLDLLNIHR